MVLITGANGRIGNSLVRELNARGVKPMVLVRESSDLTPLQGLNYELVYGDVLNTSSFDLKLSNIDTIFHLAGHINISFRNKKKTFSTNIDGTKNIVELCLKNNIKLVYTSSIHAFATVDDVITEVSPFCIDVGERRGIYDCSKAFATKQVLSGIEKGLKAIIVAPTGVIGPYDFAPSFFGKSMIAQIKSGIRYTIEGRYDYVDVRDVVATILRAVELERWGQTYILSGGALSTKDIAAYLREFEGKSNEREVISINFKIAMIYAYLLSLFNRNSHITPYSIATLNSRSTISHEKATRELGYSPRDIKVSLRDQYDWFKRNGYLGN